MSQHPLVVGGSGAGKSRGFALPNIMQCCCSMVITDPKAELLRKTGGLLEKKDMRCVSLTSSTPHNPPKKKQKKKKNPHSISKHKKKQTPNPPPPPPPPPTKKKDTPPPPPPWPSPPPPPPKKKNHPKKRGGWGWAQEKERKRKKGPPFHFFFLCWGGGGRTGIPAKRSPFYKQAAGKTAKSILISVGVRLAAFNLPQIAKLTNTDELDLSSMGERKVALFCCIPDADTSLNYLVGMIYSQLFQTLYYMADRVHGGALPVPVNCIMDEFPNVSLPNEFEKILATCRSRSIYCSIIIQNMSQLKALFKDSWESLVGNCDEFLYLGGNEKETHKYVSELLGKETIDTNTYGQTKGKSGSYSTNFQQSGRELLQPDEVRMLDNQNALLFIRGERPILDAKYDLMKHPNIRYTEDGGAGPFNYAKAPLAHDDFTFDETRYDDYELLLDEDIIGELF